VRAQVDRDLSTVSWVDRLLGLIKNLGRHTHRSLRDDGDEDAVTGVRTYVRPT
jgi:hypothetical protein